MYRVLLITMCACGLVTLVNFALYLSADRGVHATCFYFTRSACTELLFTMFRFVSHIFSVVPCTVHSDLASRVCSVLIQLWVDFDSSCFEILLHLLLLCFSCLLSFCCVSTLSSVLCRIVVHVRCFVWYPCCFCVLVGVFVSLEKRSCFLVVIVFECL